MSWKLKIRANGKIEPQEVRQTMATIIIKDAVTIEWSDVPQEVTNAIVALLYQIEENQELKMVSHIE